MNVSIKLKKRIEPGSPALQADSFTSEPQGKLKKKKNVIWKIDTSFISGGQSG